MQSKKFIVSMLGARMNYAIPRVLLKTGKLRTLITDFYFHENIFRKFIRALLIFPIIKKTTKDILSRHHIELDNANIASYQVSGFLNILRRRYADLKKNKLKREMAKLYGSNILASLLKKSSFQGDILYAFQGAAEPSFREAKKLGITCILEQSIAARPYTQELIIPEIEQWGSWYEDSGLPRKSKKNNEALINEFNMADKIIAASDFVKDSLVSCGVPIEKISVFPYGVKIPNSSPKEPDYDGSRPLKVLFAGNVDLRKGAHYLIQAANKLGPNLIQVRMLGKIGLKKSIVEKYNTIIDFQGRVPRKEMHKHFHWADVFVLPSLIEGSATVVYEALSHGLPAVVTPNTGSVVEDNYDGQIIKPHSYESLIEALLQYIDNPKKLCTQSIAAREAVNKVSYERYEKDLQDFFNNI